MRCETPVREDIIRRLARESRQKEAREEVRPLLALDPHSKIGPFRQPPSKGMLMRIRVLLVVFGFTLQAGVAAAQVKVDPYYCPIVRASLSGWVPNAPGATNGAAFPNVSPTILKQTGFYPFYGKNNIHYDTFDWQVYETDHFSVFYYPEIKQSLERIPGDSESAYQQVSAAL